MNKLISLIILVLTIQSCGRPDFSKSRIAHDLLVFCPERKVYESVESAERNAPLNRAAARKNLASQAVDVDEFALALTDMINSNVCLSVAGSPPSDKVVKRFKDLGVNVLNCEEEGHLFFEIDTVRSVKPSGYYLLYITTVSDRPMYMSGGLVLLNCKDGKCVYIKNQMCWIT